MKVSVSRSESGQSIIELLLVLMVGGILVAMAVTRLGNAQNNLQRQNLAREFKVNFERARYDSVKRRAEMIGGVDHRARVRINGETSYSVVTDMNQNGVLNYSEAGGVLTGPDVRQIDFSDRGRIRLLGAGFSFPVNIRFDRRGHITAQDSAGNEITPIFYFCEGDCTVETANVSNANIIVLSATGTVAMLNGGEPIPPYQDPTVTSVNVGKDINPWVVVTDENQTSFPAPGPSPTPSPTPASTPSSTPASTPAATPTASPSSTPTATPSSTPTPVKYCNKGDKPSATGCYCRLPLTVRSNGRCM